MTHLILAIISGAAAIGLAPLGWWQARQGRTVLAIIDFSLACWDVAICIYNAIQV